MDGAPSAVLIQPTCSGCPSRGPNETWKSTTRESVSCRPNFGFNALVAMAKRCFLDQSRRESEGSHAKQVSPAGGQGGERGRCA